MKQINHPGTYIRESVIPDTLNVKDAATKLDIGRSTLSNLLNGNADLSAELAARLATAFGASAQDLIDMQTAYDARHAVDAPNTITSYVPPFLDIKANAISEWAGDGLMPRQGCEIWADELRFTPNSALYSVSFRFATVN